MMNKQSGTINNTNFDEMMTNALTNIDETIEDITENNMSENPYKLNQELLDEGFIYDNTGVYVPFKEKFQLNGVEDTSRFKTRDDIYFWISRNPDKKCEIKCKWAKKTNEGFHKTRGFNIDFTLDIGDEKTLKALNKKVSFSGGKNGNPASDGTYVSFVDYFTAKVINNPCLEVLKEDSFEFPEISSDENIQQSANELPRIPQKFKDYPEDIQHQTMKILKEGTLFQEIQESVSLTHEGHKTTRNALILMEASPIVGDGVHGLLGGPSGMGKSDLTFAIAKNFPEKHVHILRNISPKNIYYDFESYDEDFNILILDDIPFNEDLVNLCKELTDNTKKNKELKTVINGKSQTFRLKGKYEVITTYAKTIPDEELANRLFNIGVSIVDKDESEDSVKDKIRDNNIQGGNENLIIQRKRCIIQACIHYLIEQKPRVYNPFLSIFNPANYNNRDINHFINMTKARTFFELPQRKQIQINNELSITIGSYQDLKFVHDIWAKDETAQLYKLSERQKQILDILPEMTSEEAYKHVEDFNTELNNTQSRAYKKTLKDNEPFAKSIAKKLKCNIHTLKNDLDRVSEGTQKSLIEIGLVEKIQLDEDNMKSPNFYYKVQHDEDVLNTEKSNMYNMQIQFTYSFNSLIVKQKILIDLLIYVNILINERGIHALKKYCNQYKQNINVENYSNIIDFIQGYFETLNDEYMVNVKVATSDDIKTMMNFHKEILENLQEKDTPPHTPSDQEIYIYTKNDEHSSNPETRNISCVNENHTCLHIDSLRFQDRMKEIGIDVNIAMQIHDLLTSGSKALDEIRNSICEFMNPEDIDNQHLPLKVEMAMKKLEDNDFIKIDSFSDGLMKYCLDEKFLELTRGDGSC